METDAPDSVEETSRMEGETRLGDNRWKSSQKIELSKHRDNLNPGDRIYKYIYDGDAIIGMIAWEVDDNLNFVSLGKV